MDSGSDLDQSRFDSRRCSFTHRTYAYFDPSSSGVKLDAMLASLRQAKPGDVVLLHGCCHNPTGASLTDADWDEVCEVLLAHQLVPFLDLAYQGFGEGLDRGCLCGAAVRKARA